MPWPGRSAGILSSKRPVKNDTERAKNYAFLLLKFRLRSEQEIYARLKKKKFSGQIIKDTLDYLKENKFIDDEYFAKAWIESRLKNSLGLRKISRELKAKGIAEEIISSRLQEIKEGYCEKDAVKQLAEERLSKLKGVEPQKAKRRLYAYLLRRGFSPDVIYEALSII